MVIPRLGAPEHSARVPTPVAAQPAPQAAARGGSVPAVPPPPRADADGGVLPVGRPLQRAAADGGSVTVLAAVAAVVLVAAVALFVQLGAAMLARQRAETGADLAALAAAAAILRGPDAACAAAIRIAERNGGTLTDCRIRGPDAFVTVSCAVSAGPLTGTATGRARAGPVAPITG